MVFDKVKEIIVDQLGVSEDKVTPDALFIDDLGADSMGIVSLIMSFEEEFDMEVLEEDVENITTVQSVVDYINSHAQN